MNMKDLLVLLGVEPEQAERVANAEEALNEDEIHLIRLFLEAVDLGERIERKRWENALRRGRRKKK